MISSGRLNALLWLGLATFTIVLAQGDGEGFGTRTLPRASTVSVKSWASSATKAPAIVSTGSYSASRAPGTALAGSSTQQGPKTQTIVLSTVLSVLGAIAIAIAALVLLRARARRNAALRRQQYTWTKRYSAGWGADVKTMPPQSDLEQRPSADPFQIPDAPSPLSPVPTHTRKMSWAIR